MLTTVGSAIGLFAATNIDDIVVLTVLFLASRNGSPRPWQIVGGQYVGFITLVAISVVAALGLTIVPDQWVGLLGLIPLSIGIWTLIRGLLRKRNGEDSDLTLAAGLWSVAGITIANGADNIALHADFSHQRPGRRRGHDCGLPRPRRRLVRRWTTDRNPRGRH